MAESVQSQPATFKPPSPSLGRRTGRLLNTIIEEETEENEGVQYATNNRGLLGPSSNLKIEAWLSPLSEHFPTPRGFHFLSAPILPSSPSSASADEASSPSTPSNPWNNNRSSVMTDVTEFDDLYDISDEDVQPALRRAPSRKASVRRRNSGRNETTKETPVGTRRALPPLVIPAGRSTSTEDWSAGLKKVIASPVPPTPPTRVEMSPQVFSFMQAQQAQEVPTISAPPSLDGSLSSEQMAQMSAPPTPIIGSEGHKEEDWSGVRLQPGALATLHALSGDNDSLHEHEHGQNEQVLEIPRPSVSEIRQQLPEMRQQPLRVITNMQPRPQRVAELTPNTYRRSLADLTKLDIPSPGGFFSGLSPRTRNTWHMPSRSPEDMVPPTSTTAEQFYRCPWNVDAPVPPVPVAPSRFVANDSVEQFYRNSLPPAASPSIIVEHVIEVQEEEIDEDDMPTARPTVPTVASAASVTLTEPTSPGAEDAPTEIVTVYDPEYARKQQEVALSNLDRTEMWLMAQRVYLKPVEVEQTEDDHSLNTIPEVADEDAENPKSFPEPEVITSLKKKTVRFSEFVAKNDTPRRLPSKLLRQESAYYRAFQDYIIRSSKQDVFVHQLPRFEALQAQRVCLREFHRNQLLGKHQLSVVPQSAKKRLSANVARGDDILVDDPEKLKREKEHEAMSQMAISTWHVAAIRMLNDGKLISAPVAKRLARISRMGSGRDRARILDLGGQSTCDWAWHCALQYPNTKIYTVTTKAIRQLSNSNVRGPPNHRQVAVERLTRLPFKNAQFDLVSARELHSILKFVGENGEDEWETCLRECMRVLKPGGYIDFSVLDSDIMNAGPLGLAKSVEFGFDLKTLGYDPNPTKMFLGRLSRAGFDEVRRVWMCLPMGARHPSQQSKPLPSLPVRDSSMGEEVRTVAMEAMVTGSTDSIANVTGIVGGWSWERWLLRCEMEKVSGELRLADTVTDGAAMREAGKSVEGVAAIVEEGRSCGAGWRMLNGYARKPKIGTGFISVGFADSQ